MSEISEKQKYELWWEYLLESEAYKAYCNGEIDTPNASMGLRLTFDFFGDVFSDSFENWWKNRKEKDPGIGVVEFSRQQAEYEFDKTVKEFLRSHGREPSLNEFRERYFDILFNHLPGSFLTRTFFSPNLSTKDLQVQFGKLIGNKRKSPKIKKSEKEFKKGWLPIVGRFRYDELKRYLDVYRLKESGMKIDEILEKMNPHVTRNKEDFYQDIRHAKKIIENVEDGCFPGDY